MSNSVGSVSIDLEANLARFTSDLGRAQRIMEQHARSMVRTASTVAGALGAGISIVGIERWIKGAIDAQDAISKMSQKVAVSTETLSGWQLAAQQAGVGNEALQQGLVKLGQSAALAAEGGKLQANAFKSIGVSATDASGHLKSVETLFGQVADKLASYKDSTEKTVVATRLFGKAGADLIPLLNAGKQGLAEYIKMADDFGMTVGSDAAKAAEAFNDSLEQMSFVSKGVANQIAIALAPAMAELAEKAVAFFRTDSWKATLQTISEGAKTAADHIGDVVQAVKTLIDSLDDIAVFVASRLVFAKIAAGMSLAATATSALTGSMVLLRGAIAAAGGWIGVVVTAFAGLAVAVYRYATRTSEAQQATDNYKQLLDRLHGASETQLQDSRKLAQARAEEAQKTIGAAQAELALMEARLHAFEGMQKQLQPAAHMPGIRADSQMGASYAATAASQTQKNIDAQLAFIAANKKGLADLQQFLATSVAGSEPAATAVAGLGKDLAIVNDNAAAAAKALDDIASAYAKLQGLNDTADGRNTDPVSKAWADSAARIRAIADAGADLIKNGVDESRVHEVVEQSITKETAARDRALVAASKEMDTTGQLIQQLQQEAAMAGMSERNQFITRNGIQAETAYREKNVNATEDQIAAQRRLVEEAAGNAFDMEKIAQQQNQIAQEYAGFWENAASSIARSFGDLVVSGLRKWSDFGRSLKSIAQQFVSDIIAQFVRLRILGPLLSGAMGSVAGWLGIAGSLAGSSISQSANYYGNGSSIGETAGAVGGAGGNGYAGMLSNISSMRSAYQYATGGGIQLSGGTIVGGNSIVTAPSGLGGGGYGINMPGGTVVYGNGATVTPYSPYGGNFTAGGYAVPYASIGGGLLGAYYGSKQGGGGFSTVASTVSYGALGAGIAGTAAGVAGGASLGAAAGGAFGAAAGMSWIPVVGWVLAAMALVDMVSGGKLFGTKYQTAASDATLRVGAEGGEASASLYQTKQRALFGGRKTRVVQQAVPQEMQDAADALYNSIARSMVQGAQKLGVDVPAMIEASLNTHTTYNDKGQVRATEYVVDYLGRTWKEATAEAAASRIGAEALVATVAASAGEVAQTIAEQWRKSADTLLDGAQTMLAAQVDINKGNSLIALGATATLSQVIKFVQGMQADGEKLADTYARVAAASAQYVQFVAQFAPVGAGFGASLQAINKQMQANLDQANALAQAAGMQHAAESDLANIHQFAAHQAADAIMQLNAAAQDLAAKLYNVTTNTLASVSAQIDKLQSKVQTAAQLAIGDNSPLSGKEKLDVALQGLRSGITSADDVLALGRKLYASGSDYAGLFAKVSEILQLPGATGQQSLTDAMTGYNALIGQRDQLAAQAAATQRFGDAKTLAQYVADISTTHGISYGEAAGGLGFSLNDLAKDLGLTNISGYLDSLEQQDVAGTTLTASANIVDAVRGIGHDIVQAILGGPLVQPGPVTTTATQGPDEQQIALLQSISAQLADMRGDTASTAATNQQMAKQGASDALRNVTSSSRSVAA